MTDPLVSVHMITYNHRPYIQRAIEGVLNQEREYSLELVIGEDYSSDGTRDVVHDYQRKYPDIIRIISSERNVGLKSNFYRTFKACRGKYVAFCEGDDYWHDSSKVQKQVSYMRAQPTLGMVYTDFDVFNEKTGKTIKNIVETFRLNIQKKVKVSDFIEGKGIRAILTSTVMIRKDLSNMLIDEDHYLYQDERVPFYDVQLWAELSSVSDMGYIPESLATYRVREESVSNSKDKSKQLRFKIAALEMKIYLCEKYNLPMQIMDEKQDALRDYLLQLAFTEQSSSLADRAVAGQKTLTLKKWLLYYGSKNIAINYAYRIAAKMRALFGKREVLYWDE